MRRNTRQAVLNNNPTVTRLVFMLKNRCSEDYKTKYFSHHPLFVVLIWHLRHSTFIFFFITLYVCKYRSQLSVCTDPFLTIIITLPGLRGQRPGRDSHTAATRYAAPQMLSGYRAEDSTRQRSHGGKYTHLPHRNLHAVVSRTTQTEAASSHRSK